MSKKGVHFIDFISKTTYLSKAAPQGLIFFLGLTKKVIFQTKRHLFKQKRPLGKAIGRFLS
ncbi:MAG TPA: hypothetical protein VNQ80_17450 [Parapedobacter sp.]|uniref:hypothetical protein n=1 Tax=Parapedobacter sp. TaxID=1958893 RepID=UPI002C34248F|nr:hypothetical protein [Parapedobacter sp.]HWK59134.1 hypothetical protein [Parapedobacter sp.]